MKQLISISNTAIRQQGDLYCLNDLHQAAGGEDKHRPGIFLDNAQTKELALELENAGIPAFKSTKGRNGGTYACKELVIAYASWISAAFHLKVIGVFLDSVQSQALPPARQASEAAKIFAAGFKIARLIGCDTNAAAISANQYTRKHTGLNVLEDLGKTHLIAESQDSADYTPTELGMRMGGLSGRAVNQALHAAGLQYKEADIWLPTEAGKAHSVWVDTAKRHTDGAPVKQLKWHDSVLPLLELVMQSHQEAAL